MITVETRCIFTHLNETAETHKASQTGASHYHVLICVRQECTEPHETKLIHILIPQQQGNHLLDQANAAAAEQRHKQLTSLERSMLHEELSDLPARCAGRTSPASPLCVRTTEPTCVRRTIIKLYPLAVFMVEPCVYLYC